MDSVLIFYVPYLIALKALQSFVSVVPLGPIVSMISTATLKRDDVFFAVWDSLKCRLDCPVALPSRHQVLALLDLPVGEEEYFTHGTNTSEWLNLCFSSGKLFK